MLLARGFLISLVFFVSRQELLVLCPGTRNFVGYVGAGYVPRHHFCGRDETCCGAVRFQMHAVVPWKRWMNEDEHVRAKRETKDLVVGGG